MSSPDRDVVAPKSPAQTDRPSGSFGGRLPQTHGHHRAVVVPVLLFVLTCASSFWAGYWTSLPPHWQEGAIYAAALMTILVCHEAGHFFQARRYGILASFPYFIPMPFTPIGTMGAVIAMESRVGSRRAVFDIGISGPLAGLVPTVLFSLIGLSLSTRMLAVDLPADMPRVNVSILFQWAMECTVGRPAPGEVIYFHPLASAGWVGLLITSLNLIPIGQLDGGHILYGLLRDRAAIVAWVILFAAMTTVTVGVVVYHRGEIFGWMFLILLLIVMGPRHPPASQSHIRLNPGREILGFATLAFVPLGFTPVPFAYIGF